MTSIRLVYFSWVREALGLDGEVRELPDTVCNVGDCIDWLIREDEKYRAAFADRARLRFALDQQMVDMNSPLAGSHELAVFPPVTGG